MGAIETEYHRGHQVAILRTTEYFRTVFRRDSCRRTRLAEKGLIAKASGCHPGLGEGGRKLARDRIPELGGFVLARPQVIRVPPGLNAASRTSP
jgi:hypothetical protein